MARRPTRSIAILLAILGLLFSISILENKLKTYSGGRLSIITAPTHQASPPPENIVKFWDHFAEIFYKARPTIPAINLEHGLEGVDLEGTDQSNTADRTPFSKSLNLPPDFITSLAQSHLKLITHTAFDRANDDASSTFTAGTGIVLVAGGANFPPVLLTIRMLRATNCTLPIQVFLPLPTDYEPTLCEQHLPPLNARCLILSDHILPHNPFPLQSHHLKPLSILLSSFSQILSLDSDTFPLLDPNPLFSSPPFTTTGLLSWPDYWLGSEDPTFYKIAGLAKFPKGVPARSSETGQFMIDKSKHLSSLLLATYYNLFGPDIYYPILSQGAIGGGDKETFLAAAVVLGKSFYRIKEHVGTVGYRDPNGDFHGGAMVQYHPADEWVAVHGNATEKATALTKPRPLFLHANAPEMNVAQLLDDKSVFLAGTEQRIRLWGEKNSVVELFGVDLEMRVWDEMRGLACELEGEVEDWRGREGVCRRANEHFKGLFDQNAVNVPEGKKGG